jgi:cation:H+ antiporter
MLVAIIISVVSLAVLLLASDWFIDSAERIGLSFGISPFIIGVTIVAFGTSLPELATSIASVFEGASEIVAGNVIGSNITNILLVLGLTAVVGRQINLDFDIWDIDMPLLIGSAILLYFCLQDQVLSTFECLIFLTALAGFLINSVRGSTNKDPDNIVARPRDYIKLLAGGVLVYLGADWTIYGIIEFCNLAGFQTEVVSQTFVALGTSLPEVVVSVAAAKKGKHAIAVGNILGSNIFNTYAVMAIPGLFGPLLIKDIIIDFSLPFMLGVTLLFGAITISKRISFWEGILLLSMYGFFLVESIQSIA